MALIGPRDSKPEMLVRRLVHGLGFRYKAVEVTVSLPAPVPVVTATVAVA
jgi:G:T-mismatch repair DNA endonuclease (very short patch repair protein)